MVHQVFMADKKSYKERQIKAKEGDAKLAAYLKQVDSVEVFFKQRQMLNVKTLKYSLSFLFLSLMLALVKLMVVTC
jgi:hypothetical protein